MKYNFDTEKVTKGVIDWIREWFAINGSNCKAVIGISGGKDSTVAAKLCVEALGNERVYGVLMPNGDQHDLGIAIEIAEYLGIEYCVINIENMFDDVINSLTNELKSVTEQTRINIAPRLRMLVLRGVCQSVNGRMVNTSNLSEDWVGYCTIDGDAAGDFSPLSYLTASEVKNVGTYLNIPDEYVNKTPEDGLTGVSDEVKFGFTYDDLDGYIRGYRLISRDSENKIVKKFNQNRFKLDATIGLKKYKPNVDYLYTHDESKFDGIFEEISYLKKYQRSLLPPSLKSDPRNPFDLNNNISKIDE